MRTTCPKPRAWSFSGGRRWFPLDVTTPTSTNSLAKARSKESKEVMKVSRMWKIWIWLIHSGIAMPFIILQDPVQDFLVLPSLVALVVASLIITASQVTAYACSRGELTSLQLTNSHSLEFHPWQTRYEVLLDTSFRQVTLVASSDPSTTQWILEGFCCGFDGICAFLRWCIPTRILMYSIYCNCQILHGKLLVLENSQMPNFESFWFWIKFSHEGSEKSGACLDRNLQIPSLMGTLSTGISKFWRNSKLGPKRGDSQTKQQEPW